MKDMIKEIGSIVIFIKMKQNHSERQSRAFLLRRIAVL